MMNEWSTPGLLAENEQSELTKRLQTIDVDAVRKQLESRKYPNYFIAGAIDFLKNGRRQILIDHAAYRAEPEKLPGIMSVAAEGHIRSFAPPGWIEPINKTIGHADYELCNYLGEVVTDALIGSSQ